MMECIKTGCHIYIQELNEWAYGDAFSMEVGDGEPWHSNVYAFHLAGRSHEPFRSVKHYEVRRIAHWFDEERTSQEHNSTLISTNVISYSYDGVPL